MGRLTRHLLALAATAAAASAATPAALGASQSTYVVESCGTAPEGRSSAWAAFNTSPATLRVSRHCPPAPGALASGLAYRDRLGALTTPHGARAGFRFTAPPGTVLSGSRGAYRLWVERTEGWNHQTRDGNGTVLTTCQPSPNQCGTGGTYPGGIQVNPWVSFSPPTRSFEAYVTCERAGGCLNGALEHAAVGQRHALSMRIDDLTPPTIAPPGGTLAAGGELAGTADVTISASDVGGGLSRVGLETAAGSVLTSAALSCDYTRPTPCPTDAQRQLQVDTTRLPDGVHTLRPFAEEAGGPVSRVSGAEFQIEVRNGGRPPAPPAPGPPPSGGGGSEPSPPPSAPSVPFLQPGGPAVPAPGPGSAPGAEGRVPKVVAPAPAQQRARAPRRRPAIVIRAPKGRVIQVRLLGPPTRVRAATRSRGARRVLTTRRLTVNGVPTLMPVSAAWRTGARRAQWRLLPAPRARVRRPGPWRGTPVRSVSLAVIKRASSR